MSVRALLYCTELKGNAKGHAGPRRSNCNNKVDTECMQLQGAVGLAAGMDVLEIPSQPDLSLLCVSRMRQCLTSTDAKKAIRIVVHVGHGHGKAGRGDRRI